VQKTKINTALAIFLVATAVMLIGGSAMMTTTQTAEATRSCEIDPDDGSVTCSGGEGSGGKPEQETDSERGGSGNHITCDVENICTSQGGRGGYEVDQEGNTVGGSGGRVTGDFDTGPVEVDGGSGQHPKGPGGNSE